MVEASEKWASQISRFSETTSGANHNFEGTRKKFASGVERKKIYCTPVLMAVNMARQHK